MAFIDPIEEKIDEGTEVLDESQNWLTTYSDIVTTLLCFFIIFYSIEKSLEKSNMPIDLKIKTAQSESQLKEAIVVPVVDELGKSLEQLNQLEAIQVVEDKDSGMFDIIFQDLTFFDLGSYQLTDAGKLLLKESLSQLLPFQDSIWIEIQGHADATPVIFKRNRWWNTNLELSALRSLHTFQFLHQIGFSPEALSVSAFGNFRKLAEEKDLNNKSEIDSVKVKNRRISIRITRREKRF